MADTTYSSEQFCLVPLNDKLAVVEGCISALEDIQQVLQRRRKDINFIIEELANLDGDTTRLMMHTKLIISGLKKEAGSSIFYPKQANTRSSFRQIPQQRQAYQACRGNRTRRKHG